MDVTGTERAVIASISTGAQRALLLCADHPERVLAAAFIAPLFPVSRLASLPIRFVSTRLGRRLFMRPPPIAKGSLKYNGAHWRRDYRDFVEWFVGRIFTTPHSTKQIEDAVGWALETDAETLIASTLADDATPRTRRDQLALARRVQCPVVVISAPEDALTPHADAKALAGATDGRSGRLRRQRCQPSSSGCGLIGCGRLQGWPADSPRPPDEARADARGRERG